MATAKQDDRDPLEAKLDGDLRLLHQRGLVEPDTHDLEGLLRVAGALSDAGTDLQKIEAALALAFSDYGDDAKVETMHLWYGLQPRTRETRQLSSSERYV